MKNGEGLAAAQWQLKHWCVSSTALVTEVKHSPMQAAGKKELHPRQTHTPQTDRAGPRGVNATQAVNSL